MLLNGRHIGVLREEPTGKDAVYARRIDAWWSHRAIPATRDGIRRALETMGIRCTVELLNHSLGLSLSDQYWVKPQSNTDDLKQRDSGRGSRV
ncbi:hypothetical protein [Bifidobacterium callitrichos]|uniref:hypothetical protein n=1 Tax=Bifidobacterium callitrichos TaxID=762209 RepID=UPI0015E6AF70